MSNKFVNWHPVKAVEDNVYLILDYEGKQVARFTGPEAEINVNVASAALVLVAACEQALYECVDLIGTPAGIALEKAIARAKGETNA